MASSQQVTLSRFFFSDKETSSEQLSVVESSKKMAALKETVLREAKVMWPVALNLIVEKLKEVLNINLPDIIVIAWNKYKVLLQYLDKEKYPPDETFLVAMSEHTITSEHHPFIEIRINQQLVGKIDFDITISLTLEGIVLKIQDGKIKGLHVGTCKGKGLIRCENRVILEKETESISLPGSIDLGDGIPIAA